jgi:phytol kinase
MEGLSRGEFERKLIHLPLGVIVLFLYKDGLISAWHIAALLLAGVLLSALHVRRPIPALRFLLDRVDRKESIPGKGAMTFVVGLLLSAALFPMDIAVAAMAVLTFADAAGALIGMRFGRMANPLNSMKTFEGSLAVLVVSYLVAWAIVGAVPAYGAAIVAALLESIKTPQKPEWLRFLLDDNILVPLGVGVILVLFSIVL